MQDSSEHIKEQGASDRPWPWPLVACFLLLLIAVFIALVATGVVEVGFCPRPEAEVKPGDHAEPAAVCVERLPYVEKCFQAAGFTAYAWRYSGGPVESWFEAEKDGRTEVLARFSGRDFTDAMMAMDFEQPLTPELLQGYIILIHRCPLPPNAPYPISHYRPFPGASKNKSYLVGEVWYGPIERDPRLDRHTTGMGQSTHIPLVLPLPKSPGQHEPTTKPSVWDPTRTAVHIDETECQVADQRQLHQNEEAWLYKSPLLKQRAGRWAFRLKCKLLPFRPKGQKPQPASTSAPATGKTAVEKSGD